MAYAKERIARLKVICRGQPAARPTIHPPDQAIMVPMRVAPLSAALVQGRVVGGRTGWPGGTRRLIPHHAHRAASAMDSCRSGRRAWWATVYASGMAFRVPPLRAVSPSPIARGSTYIQPRPRLEFAVRVNVEINSGLPDRADSKRPAGRIRSTILDDSPAARDEPIDPYLDPNTITHISPIGGGRSRQRIGAGAVTRSGRILARTGRTIELGRGPARLRKRP